MLKKTKRISKKKMLVQIQQQLEELTKKYNENFNQVLHKSQQYEEVSDLCKNISFKVDKAKVFFDMEKGIYGIDIKFKPNDCKIYVDSGEVIKNNFIYSISKMNMLSMQDMRILSDLIEQAKQKSAI